jgi:predicted DNA binding CopG/RHH family protein
MDELVKMSVQNMGLGRQVFDNSYVKNILSGFFEEYASPMIWNNKMEYGGVKEHDCSDTNLYQDQELVCLGELKVNSNAEVDEPGEGQLTANVEMFRPGKCKVLNRDNSVVPYTEPTSLMKNPNPRPRYVDLAKVFAYQNMKKKLDLYKATRDDNLRAALKKDITDFAVAQAFVTRFTSLVVVEARVVKRRSAEKEEKIKQLFQDFNAEVEHLLQLEDLEQSENETSNSRLRRSSGFESARSQPKLTFVIFTLLAIFVVFGPLRRFTRRN